MVPRKLSRQVHALLGVRNVGHAFTCSRHCMDVDVHVWQSSKAIFKSGIHVAIHQASQAHGPTNPYKIQAICATICLATSDCGAACLMQFCLIPNAIAQDDFCPTSPSITHLTPSQYALRMCLHPIQIASEVPAHETKMERIDNRVRAEKMELYHVPVIDF